MSLATIIKTPTMRYRNLLIMVLAPILFAFFPHYSDYAAQIISNTGLVLFLFKFTVDYGKKLEYRVITPTLKTSARKYNPIVKAVLLAPIMPLVTAHGHRTAAQAGMIRYSDRGSDDDGEGDADHNADNVELNQSNRIGQNETGKRERLLSILTRIEALEARIKSMEAINNVPAKVQG